MKAVIMVAAVCVAGALLATGCGSGASSSSADSSIKVKGFYIGMPGTEACALINSQYLKIFGPAVVTFTAFPEAERLSQALDARRSKKWREWDVFLEGQPPTWEKLPVKPISITTNNRPDYNVINYEAVYDKCFVMDREILVGNADITFDGRFGLDASGNVEKIMLPPETVNALFNASALDTTEFVKQFIDAYGIPEMTPSDDLESWVYTSPGGVKVAIDQQKKVTLEKVPSAAEKTQSFN